jgi:pimeloyl-ACP methyl ester carboxylesterase
LTGPSHRSCPRVNGNLFLDRAKFHDAFAADVTDEDAAFMADSQVPWGLDALGGTITEAAWHAKPSYYLHVTDDHMIPPAAQNAMAERIGATVAQTPGSHAIYVSQPKIVADLIRAAAQTISE